MYQFKIANTHFKLFICVPFMITRVQFRSATLEEERIMAILSDYGAILSAINLGREGNYHDYAF